MNLVSLAMNFITPSIVSRIASALGIESKMAQMAISAALPSILAGIVGKSSKPDGLGQLTSMLGQQDPGLLSNLAGMIGGSDQSKLVGAGSNMLGSLLGNSALGSLAGAIGKFSGVGEAPTKSLLGMLAPVAMGTLAQQQKSQGLDAAGLARMLMGQKENIANAIPSGFGDMLKGTGLLDGFPKPSVGNIVGDAARTAGAAASSTMASAGSAARSAAQDIGSSTVKHATAPTASGLPSWLTWGALLAALLAGFYMFGPGSGRQVATPPARIMHNNVDLVPQVGNLYNGLRDTLGNVRDQASAQAALPRLQEGAKTLQDLTTLAGQMPAATRGDLGRLMQGYVPNAQNLIETALKTAGVSGVLKPVLEQILSRMVALAKG
jgi:hypothetical protein